MATHQGQSEPELVVTAQSCHGPPDFRGLQLIHAAELLKNLKQGQEGFPVAVGAVVQQPLPLLNLLLQLLHPAPMLLQLLAISPAMGGMGVLLLFQGLHHPGLGQHLPRQVVLRRRHVVTPGHMSHREGQTTTGLIAMAQFTGLVQVRSCNSIHLQTAQFGMDADDGLAWQQQPDVLIAQTEEQRELTGAVNLVDDHSGRYPAAQLR